MPNLTQVIPFTTPSNYVYNSSLIRVLSGQAILSGSVVPTDYTEDFNDAAGLTFNAADIEIVGGTHAALRLQNNAGQTFNQDFSSVVGFTYDALKTQIAAGTLSQIQQNYRPTYYRGRIFANFTSSMDANYTMQGSVSAATVGAPVLGGGKLQCLGGGNNGIYWDNAAIGSVDNVLTIIVKYTPNYNGAPALNTNIVELNNGVDNVNKVVVFHGASGAIRITVYDDTGASKWVAYSIVGFAPVSGTEYEIMFTLDTSAATIRVWIDGAVGGSNTVASFTRSNTATRMIVGAGTFYSVANGSYDDVILYKSIEQTGAYVPAAYGIADPKQPTFYAGYGEDINGDWGDGVLTGTPTGGASVSGGKLALDQNDVRYVTYPATNHTDGFINRGCIRYKYTPNYNGSPGVDTSLFVIGEAAASVNNLIQLRHSSGGGIQIYITDSAGVIITNYTTPLFNAVLGTEVEMELNFDTMSGATRFFVDGTQLGVTQTGTGTRTSPTGLFRIGGNFSGVNVSNGLFDDVLVFDDPQHTTNYTPDWSGVNPYEYEGDAITFPGFSYSGAGSVQAFTAFAETATNNPRYTINNLYWSGAAWVASSNTYATASPAADILANIATLPASDTPVLKLFTQNSIGTQMTVDDTTLTYTGQIYPTTNPTIDLDTPIISTNPGVLVSAINSFVATISAAGGDAVSFALSNDNQVSFLYYNGAAWVASTGYATSSTNAQITAGLSTFPITLSGTHIKVYLHSNDGSTTPEISNLVVNFNDGSFITGTEPTIYYSTPISTTAILSISTVESVAGSDAIQHVVNINNVDYWYNGAAWAASTSYAESNPLATITANLASLNLLLASRASVYIKSYFHSDDGSTSPSLDTMTISYTFGGVLTPLNECLVWGYVVDAAGDPVSGVAVTASLTRDTKISGTVCQKGPFSATTDALGYWEISLVNNAEMSPSAQYDFVFAGTTLTMSDRKTVPNQATANYNTLTG